MFLYFNYAIIDYYTNKITKKKTMPAVESVKTSVILEDINVDLKNTLTGLKAHQRIRVPKELQALLTEYSEILRDYPDDDLDMILESFESSARDILDKYPSEEIKLSIPILKLLLCILIEKFAFKALNNWATTHSEGYATFKVFVGSDKTYQAKKTAERFNYFVENALLLNL